MVRHRRGCNALFLHWHSEYVAAEEMTIDRGIRRAVACAPAGWPVFGHTGHSPTRSGYRDGNVATGGWDRGI